MRLIDADELVKKMLLLPDKLAVVEAPTVVKAPTVDTVNVVQCAFCKYWKPHTDGQHGSCRRFYGVSFTAPEEFCSRGVRNR